MLLFIASPDGYGSVTYDIGYGGAFYAIVNARQLNMDLTTADIHKIIFLGDSITRAVSKFANITHPENSDLAYLFGTILIDGPDTGTCTKNICVYGDKQVNDTRMYIHVHTLTLHNYTVYAFHRVQCIELNFIRSLFLLWNSR